MICTTVHLSLHVLQDILGKYSIYVHNIHNIITQKTATIFVLLAEGPSAWPLRLARWEFLFYFILIGIPNLIT